ncbi:phosphate ABC transporter substrate-binding protein PstS [Synechococcus lacustris]|uniref:phosphate ABC transporter substrate-binding protein PstS n=1 Tax=Synechococcus lacustris TaxID=2116544 RepID=UPI0020CF285B|nr:phosphate ABC transporter substrate-binding protein PstS [Synechococcus lacustris]MCP9812826.1 phosphate ABC transporter substrate-binding protein PstS [Synechococcus lacustris L1E-Slac]
MPVAKKAVAFSAIAALSTVTILPVLAQATISGAGASFPAPIYQRWFADYANTKGGSQVNYQSVGSGAGVRQFVAGSVDFGATDEPIKDSEAAKVSRGVVQIPMVGGSIAVAYNKPGCELKLTQKQLADIFLGNITDWKELKCAAGPISVAHRSDGSGTTFAFTNSLSTFSPEWKSKVGEGKSVQWPVGVGGKGNEGVAGVIQQTPGSIGYLNQSYVRGVIKAAAVQNKARQFVKPTAVSGAAGLDNIKLNDMNAGEDPNPAGAKSYPIVTLTWILAYKTGNGDKTQAIQKALNYALSPAAQKLADDLGYVPLEGNILAKAKAAVKQIGK